MISEVSDNELIMMALEENEEAKNELFNRYKYIIDIVIKKYSKVASYLGIDYKDFYSEGLYGFSDALVNYNQDKNASLATFITLCVDRRLQKELVHAGRLKNKLNYEALSLDYFYEKLNLSLEDLLSDEKFEPLQNMTKEESYQELISEAKEKLSDFEYTVFTFMANGFDYQKIAAILNKTPKQIDNTMQRIKNKLKKILETR